MNIFQESIFLYLLCGHLIGDFYAQSAVMAVQKYRNWRLFGEHMLIYAGAVVIAVSPNLRKDSWFWILIPVAVHGLLNGTRALLCRRQAEHSVFLRYEGRLFMAGQALQLIALLGTASALAPLPPNGLGRWIDTLHLTGAGTSQIPLLSIVTLGLLLGKPANVLLKHCNRAPANFKQIQTGDAAPPVCGCPALVPGPQLPRTQEYPNAGAIVGTLERLLVALLCGMEQYAAVGLVFTAKTLTRYDRIAKDPPFAEYYLIGTLGSLLFALGAAQLFIP